MNKQDWDILYYLFKHPYTSQRDLAVGCGYSLGYINQSLKTLKQEDLINPSKHLTPKATTILRQRAPQRAIILAAGFGLRMVPINTVTPKALLKVKGETLIERQIKQLHAVGIKEIIIVVGFMMERFEYLIDQYQVKLIANNEFADKNNYYSLYLAREYLDNAYVIPCDLWAEHNPFNRHEPYSWYMLTPSEKSSEPIRVNRKQEIIFQKSQKGEYRSIGIAYILPDAAAIIKNKLAEIENDPMQHLAFWENALIEKNKMIIPVRIMPPKVIAEINTYEELRDLDQNTDHLNSEAINIICDALKVSPYGIKNIKTLKKGMTNRSFVFEINKKKYIMRIPGEGTEHLINRQQEAAVYQQINGLNICDDIIYINPENGYKITRFLENARVCNPNDVNDLKKCMDKLSAFHQLEFKVDHEFDIFANIEYYQALWHGQLSNYPDYESTKQHILSLRPYIAANTDKKVLTHIDAVPDNFLFVGDDLRLIDWEYAGMQDPHVDIAMFCIYAMYDRAAVDRLIDIYFEDLCPENIRIKIYCYIAACGLLWSNWCEYKRSLGIDFGEYAFRQYRYAKEYYRIVDDLLKKKGSCHE